MSAADHLHEMQFGHAPKPGSSFEHEPLDKDERASKDVPESVQKRINQFMAMADSDELPPF